MTRITFSVAREISGTHHVVSRARLRLLPFGVHPLKLIGLHTATLDFIRLSLTHLWSYLTAVPICVHSTGVLSNQRIGILIHHLIILYFLNSVVLGVTKAVRNRFHNPTGKGLNRGGQVVHSLFFRVPSIIWPIGVEVNKFYEKDQNVFELGVHCSLKFLQWINRCFVTFDLEYFFYVDFVCLHEKLLLETDSTLRRENISILSVDTGFQLLPLEFPLDEFVNVTLIIFGHLFHVQHILNYFWSSFLYIIKCVIYFLLDAFINLISLILQSYGGRFECQNFIVPPYNFTLILEFYPKSCMIKTEFLDVALYEVFDPFDFSNIW